MIHAHGDVIGIDLEGRFCVTQRLLDQKRHRGLRCFELVTLMLQFFDPLKDLLEFRRGVVHLKAQFLSLHHHVAPPSQIADQNTALVANRFGFAVFKTVSHLLHRIDMHASLVRKRSGAHPGASRVMPHVGNLIHKVGQLMELGK